MDTLTSQTKISQNILAHKKKSKKENLGKQNKIKRRRYWCRRSRVCRLTAGSGFLRKGVQMCRLRYSASPAQIRISMRISCEWKFAATAPYL